MEDLHWALSLFSPNTVGLASCAWWMIKLFAVVVVQLAIKELSPEVHSALMSVYIFTS